MMQLFSTVLKRHVKITIMTRPVGNFKESRKAILEKTFSMLKNAGVTVRFKSKIHQKFAIIDQKTSWYGSINLLSFGYSEESIMRLTSSTIAYELIKSIDDASRSSELHPSVNGS